MSTVPHHRRFTEAEYLAIERQAETKSDFYAGEMFAMSGARRNHNLIVTNLISELREQLRKRPCEVYPSDMRVKVARTGLFTYPDVVVVCGQPLFLDDTEDTLLNPTVLIEVLSESTASYVRGFKSRRYRTIPSLREYLIIEQEMPSIERYCRTAGGEWVVNDMEEMSGTIALPAVECELKLAAVYDKVLFDKPAEQTQPADSR
jgi:Uma2 family endonuclease